MIKPKTQHEIEMMRKAGKIVGDTLKLMQKSVRIGITTKELDKIAFDFITSQGAYPSFLNYDGFPASICTSVNETVVHGIPSDYALKDGDIIGIDVGACYKGYHGDAARTFCVGNVSEKVKQLVKETRECFYQGIEGLKAGDRVGTISHRIEHHAKHFGYGIVRELVGHGVGKNLHEDPQIPNYGSDNSGEIIPPNSTLAIEPMINLGTRQIYLLGDDWTVITRDRLQSAHYENTVLVTENGVEILTLMDGETRYDEI